VSAFFALTSIVLALVVGALVSRLAYKLLAFGAAAANPVPGLLLVGLCLLGSGYGYRRRFFTTSLDCAIGIFAYAMTVILLAVDITGMDAITGMIGTAGIGESGHGGHLHLRGGASHLQGHVDGCGGSGIHHDAGAAGIGETGGLHREVIIT